MAVLMAPRGFDWPPIDGLLAFVRTHGAPEAARRLGVRAGTLRSHLNRQGLTAADYAPADSLNDDALREIRALLD